MGSETVVAMTVGIAVMFLAPALVWALVIAGLVRVVREKVRESRTTETGLIQETRHSTGSN
jgi:hypothetical protein